jgi:cell division protease FtsH
MGDPLSGEAQVPFFSPSGSDFVEMFVGVGASHVTTTGNYFIDEIDAVGRARGKSNMSGGNDEREYTESITYNGRFGTNSNVISNTAPTECRFDRQIFVDLPDIREKLRYLKYILHH